MDPQFFYVMFIPTFTILAFIIGGMFALMAMSANLNPGSDEGEGADNGVPAEPAPRGVLAH